MLFSISYWVNVFFFRVIDGDGAIGNFSRLECGFEMLQGAREGVDVDEKIELVDGIEICT